jgi:hypothetical protein
MAGKTTYALRRTCDHGAAGTHEAAFGRYAGIDDARMNARLQGSVATIVDYDTGAVVEEAPYGAYCTAAGTVAP